MSKWTVTIVCDTNDADYVTAKHHVDDDELEFIKRIAGVIKTKHKTKKGHYYNWYAGWYNQEDENKYSPSVLYKDILTDDDIDQFNDYLPGFEGGTHSINSITYVPYSTEIVIL